MQHCLTLLIVAWKSEGTDSTGTKWGEQPAFSWDLPPINDNNRWWMAEKIVQHVKQFVGHWTETNTNKATKGLKDNGILNMINECAALATVLFPRSAEQAMDLQVFGFSPETTDC